MKRDPSIHITYTNLKMILKSLGLEGHENLAQRIMQEAVPYSIIDRYVVTGDSEVRKKARKVIAASATTGITAEQFNRLLTTIRMQRQFKGVVAIRKDDTQWTLLREITQISNEFSTAQGIDPYEGAKSFITLGLGLMKHNYGLGKFKYYRERINEMYTAATMVNNDPEPRETAKVYESWQLLMKNYANYAYPIEKPEEYVKMIYVRMEAQAVGATYRNWLTAQFEFFTLLNTVPSLNQLVSETARQRYYEYMAKKGSNGKVLKNDVTDYKSDFDRRYFEALRSKEEN